jgi:hypothetical protein
MVLRPQTVLKWPRSIGVVPVPSSVWPLVLHTRYIIQGCYKTPMVESLSHISFLFHSAPGSDSLDRISAAALVAVQSILYGVMAGLGIL